MKVRNGFVSNSSSSSFVIDASKITTEQFGKIINHIKVSQAVRDAKGEEYDGCGDGFDYCRDIDEWRINVDSNENKIVAETSMDNFDMGGFLNHIGVSKDAYEEDDYGHW